MAIHIERSINVNAPPERVWAIMVDVERWPEWTESMKSVERLDSEEFGVGSKARLRMRRAPTSVFRVTENTPNRSFTWETRSAGIKGVATHTIEADGNGSKVTLSVDMSGVLATVLSPLIRPPSEENVRIEAEGLKRRAEE